MNPFGAQVEKFRVLRSLQGKATLLVIAIVAGVLALSTFFNIQASERALERDLEHNAVALARQFAAGIGSWEELKNPERLKAEIRQVMETRSSIAGIEVYAMAQGVPAFIVSGGEQVRATPGPEVSQAAREEKAVAVLRNGREGRQWEIAAPVQIGGALAGVVHLQVSLEEADRLAVRERRQAMLIMGASMGAIVLLMSLFLQRTLHRPIQNLVTTMARAEAGDLAAEADIRTQDEIGRLARSFNRMLLRIRNFHIELQEEVERATAELRVVNEKLFEAQREMGRLERLAAVGEVAAMVAHEVGTPLTSVSGHLQLLAAEVQDLRAKDRLGVIQTHIARAVSIIRGFLDSSRFPPPACRPIQVNALIQEVLALASPGIGRLGIQVMMELHPALPEIMADEDQLRQVLLNLVTNALDAMPQGGTLTIRVRVEDVFPQLPGPSAPMLIIAVTDTGGGIPPEDLRRIFDPFFTTKGPGQGTGLGLAICQRIVKAHKGSIEVKSERGKGTTFTITLPVRG